MDRRKFFKRIGFASLGVIVAPTVVAEVVKKATEPQRVLYGIIVPKPRRAGSHLMTGYDHTHLKFLKDLYKRYGNQKLNYFQWCNSLKITK